MERKWTKPPSIPENFVTIHQLQERWIKQQMQKQKEEPQSEPEAEAEPVAEPEAEPEPETQPECEVLKIGEVLEEQKSTDGKLEPAKLKKSHHRNRKKLKGKKRQARELAAEGANKDENMVNAPERKEVLMDEGRLTKMSTGGGREIEKKMPEGTGREREASSWKRSQTRVEWKRVNKVEVTGVEAHAQKTTSGNAKVADQTVNEIVCKLEELSITGGKEGGNDVRNKGEYSRSHRSGKKEEIAKSKNEVVVDDQMVQIDGSRGRPARSNNGGYHRGSNWRSEPRHRRQGNEGKVWVKRGDGSAGSAFELKTSGGSISGSA